MHEMFGWGRSVDEPVFDARKVDQPALPAKDTAGAPSFDVKETDDTYVCTVNAKLTLPDEADAAHVKAELKDGELRLVVPKATKTRRTTEEAARGSARREPRRGERKRPRRA
jgi:HSP20 family molecular chaperone IbpA